MSIKNCIYLITFILGFSLNLKANQPTLKLGVQAPVSVEEMLERDKDTIEIAIKQSLKGLKVTDIIRPEARGSVGLGIVYLGVNVEAGVKLFNSFGAGCGTEFSDGNRIPYIPSEEYSSGFLGHVQKYCYVQVRLPRDLIHRLGFEEGYFRVSKGEVEHDSGRKADANGVKILLEDKRIFSYIGYTDVTITESPDADDIDVSLGNVDVGIGVKF